MASFVRLIGIVLFAAVAHGAVAAPVPSSVAPTAPAPAVVIEGTWLTEAKSEVTIAPCDAGYCGDISKIVVPADIYQKDKSQIDAIGTSNFTDLMNKDPSLRSRPILGLTILTLQPSDKPTIFNGTIYNPQDGNTYSGYVEVLAPDRIRLNGCILYNVICKGQDWTRTIPPAADDASAGALKKKPAAAKEAPAPTASPPVTAGSFQ